MKLLHISDTHGGMPPLLEDGEIIVHSGDLMPNRSFGVRASEVPFQTRWLEENAARLKAWIGDRPFLYTPGNHDFVDPIPALRAAGVNAIGICDSFVEIDGVGFYGYPWVPQFYDWNYMDTPEKRRVRLEPAVELMDRGEVDVFVSHGPMYGVLDRTDDGVRAGSRVLRDAIAGAKCPPRLFLCGHIHEAAAVAPWKGMIVSNAATTQRVLTI